MARNYRFAEEVTVTQSGLLPAFIKPNAKCSVNYLKWDPSARTIVRILPGLSPNNDSGTLLDLCRLSDAPLDFGDWIRCYRALRVNLPNAAFSFFTKSSIDDIEECDTPAQLFFDAVQQFMPELIDSGNVTLRQLYLMQVIVLESPGENGQIVHSPPLGSSPKDPTQILCIGPSAGRSLLRLMSKYDERGLLPDPITPLAGLFVEFFVAARQGLRGNNVQFYDARFLYNYRSMTSPSLDDADTWRVVSDGYQLVKDSVYKTIIQPWDAILNFPSIQEQIDMICSTGVPVDILRYAFGRRYGQQLEAALSNERVSRAGYIPKLPASASSDNSHFITPNVKFGFADIRDQQPPPAAAQAQSGPLPPNIADLPRPGSVTGFAGLSGAAAAGDVQRSDFQSSVPQPPIPQDPLPQSPLGRGPAGASNIPPGLLHLQELLAKARQRAEEHNHKHQ